MPLLTIGLTSYNYGKYIGAAIDSILTQSFTDFELMIIDNASTDNTHEVLAKYQDPRIKVIINSENMGPHFSGDLFFEISATKYSKLFCADDVMLPGCLQKQMDLITSIPNLALVTCNMIVTDEELKPVGIWKQRDNVCGVQSLMKECFDLTSNLIGGPSNFLYRTEYAKNLKLDRAVKLTSDLDFALRVLHHGGYANTNHYGYLYRRHSESDTNQLLSRKMLCNNWFYLIVKYDHMNFPYAIRATFWPLDEENKSALVKWRKSNIFNLIGWIQGLGQIFKSKIKLKLEGSNY